MSSGNPRQDPVPVMGHSAVSWVTGRDGGSRPHPDISSEQWQVCVSATADVLSEGKLSPLLPRPTSDATHVGPHILRTLMVAPGLLSVHCRLSVSHGVVDCPTSQHQAASQVLSVFFSGRWRSVAYHDHVNCPSLGAFTRSPLHAHPLVPVDTYLCAPQAT
jgi:hypothetical protein